MKRVLYLLTDCAAYSLGSVASAYLTGGVGALSGIGRAVGATSKISKGLAAYRASKAAVNNIMISISEEFKSKKTF